MNRTFSEVQRQVRRLKGEVTACLEGFDRSQLDGPRLARHHDALKGAAQKLDQAYTTAIDVDVAREIGGADEADRESKEDQVEAFLHDASATVRAERDALAEVNRAELVARNAASLVASGKYAPL